MLNSSSTSPLQDLLLEAFSTSQGLRDFAALANIEALPGIATSRPELAFAISTNIGRAGKAETVLSYLANQYPNLASSVDRVRRELGISG